MNAVVKSINPESPLSKSIISSGDILRKINCNPICDVLDYEYYSYDDFLLLEFINKSGKIKLINLRKPEGLDLGIEFENSLMDVERHCCNNCIFCFIDQLPRGMRKSLYYKDDDIRLSFFQGNYVTLTNLSNKDIKRIIKLRISPINVSIHTLNPRLRSYMLGGDKGGTALKAFKSLAKAGIDMNCQIVCCRGVNDGLRLSRTIEGLIKLGPSIKSVSVVPVGLTKHRDGLTVLRPFDNISAKQTIRRVESYGKKCLKKRGSRVFFCADEFYMLAGLKLPENNHYEDYPQLENGVGMMRLFITEFEIALERLKHKSAVLQNQEQFDEQFSCKKSIVTGKLAKKYLTNLLNTLNAKYGKIDCRVYAVENDFFGTEVTVSGLVTGRDILAELKDKPLGTELLIPGNMLRAGEEIFLDDMTVSELSQKLAVAVSIVEPDGAALLQALIKPREK